MTGVAPDVIIKVSGTLDSAPIGGGGYALGSFSIVSPVSAGGTTMVWTLQDTGGVGSLDDIGLLGISFSVARISA